MVWGPICHQPSVPRGYLTLEPAKGLVREASKMAMKRFFWHLNPALRRAISRTDVILYANRDIAGPFKGLTKVHAQTFGGSRLPTGPRDFSTTGPLRLIHVGRQVSIKGPSVAIEAMAQCDSDVRLEFVGNGRLNASNVSPPVSLFRKRSLYAMALPI